MNYKLSLKVVADNTYVYIWEQFVCSTYWNKVVFLLLFTYSFDIFLIFFFKSNKQSQEHIQRKKVKRSSSKLYHGVSSIEHFKSPSLPM